MKKIFTIIAAVILSTTLWAQAPQKMSYQAVIRDGSSYLVTNHLVSMRISILLGTTPVYIEIQTATTNANGLVSLEIGSVTPELGIFSAIDWSAGAYSIKTETDPTGGTNYAAIVGTSQILSVPYALHAKTAESITGSAHYIGESYGGGIVFYVYDGGAHGLIAATTDQSTAISWYNGINKVTGATGDGIGAGEMNTTIIVATQISDNQAGNFAAKVCADYTLTVDGVNYGDWYLPSKLELYLLYQQKAVVGGFPESMHYWSSTEGGNASAWGMYFYFGSQENNDKFNGNAVRAIRAF